MSARVPQSGGRPWVAVHTWMLNDPDVLLAGNAARALWMSLLLWSAQAGTAGVVPADPRRVATFARLDGGVPEVADALAALVAQGLLVAGPKDGTYAIGAWAETQADLGGSTTRSASTSAARFRSAHEAGKHSGGQRKGCALCAAGRPGLAVVPEPPEPESGSREGDSPEGPPLGGARELVAEFRATFAGILEDCPTRLDGYRVLLDAARTLGAEHAGLSPRLGPALVPLRVGVGQERPVSLSAGGFLLPALRTGRATSTASGSPHAHAVRAGPHGVGMRVPRYR